MRRSAAKAAGLKMGMPVFKLNDYKTKKPLGGGIRPQRDLNGPYGNIRRFALYWYRKLYFLFRFAILTKKTVLMG